MRDGAYGDRNNRFILYCFCPICDQKVNADLTIMGEIVAGYRQASMLSRSADIVLVLDPIRSPRYLHRPCGQLLIPDRASPVLNGQEYLRKYEEQRENLIDQLSKRELEVLLLIASGLSNKKIAEDLFLSHRTVERHCSNIYSKLQVVSRTQAVIYVFRYWLI